MCSHTSATRSGQMQFSPGDIGPAIGIIGGTIGIIATLVPFIRWMRKRVSPPLPFEIRRITTADDEDINAALRLYEGRFAQTPNEMDDIEMIKKAIRNDKDNSEYFVVAKISTHPIAMMWGTFCEIDNIFWIWYIAGYKGEPRSGYLEPEVDGTEKTLSERDLMLHVGPAFESIFHMVMGDKQLHMCTRVAMELSERFYASKSQLFAARVRDLSGRLYKLDVAYRQPHLVFPSDEPEVPMTLLFADLPQQPSAGRLPARLFGHKHEAGVQVPVYRQVLSSTGAMEIIGCLYAHMYGEREESEEWSAYIQGEQERMFRLIGSGVRLESIRPRAIRAKANGIRG